jgi:hypothetical protein
MAWVLDGSTSRPMRKAEALAHHQHGLSPG